MMDRPDDWDAHKIASELITERHRLSSALPAFCVPLTADIQEDALVEAGAEAMVEAGYREVPSVEEIMAFDTHIDNVEKLQRWLMERKLVTTKSFSAEYVRKVAESGKA